MRIFGYLLYAAQQVIDHSKSLSDTGITSSSGVVSSSASRPQNLKSAVITQVLPIDSTFDDSLNEGRNAIVRVRIALAALQEWYDFETGLWRTCGWWNSANIMTLISNIALHGGTRHIQEFAIGLFANTFEKAPAKNPQLKCEMGWGRLQSTGYSEHKPNHRCSGYVKNIKATSEVIAILPEHWYDFAEAAVQAAAAHTHTFEPDDWLNGYMDDNLWWALAWIGAFDVTGNCTYLDLAEHIFTAVSKSWPTYCGHGGIYWNWEKRYVNAITNELFASTAAHLANRVDAKSKRSKDFYVAWAQKSLNWFVTSDMINDEFLINDGLNRGCNNNRRTAWSYNQGVILGALVEMDRADSNDLYLALAGRIARAAITRLTDHNGILHDACGPFCGPDASQFKGIFARNLQMLHSAAPDQMYSAFIQANAESIWANDRDRRSRLSIDWAGPFIAPANASTHSSAMDLLVAAITVR